MKRSRRQREQQAVHNVEPTPCLAMNKNPGVEVIFTARIAGHTLPTPRIIPRSVVETASADDTNNPDLWLSQTFKQGLTRPRQHFGIIMQENNALTFRGCPRYFQNPIVRGANAVTPILADEHILGSHDPGKRRLGDPLEFSRLADAATENKHVRESTGG